MSEKPEWFEMAAEDNSSSQPEVKTKPKKRLAKIALLTVPLLLVGGVMVFAEGDESDDAPAMETTTPTATVSESTASNIEVSPAKVNSVTSKKTNVVTNSATNNVPESPANGVGVPAPSGRGGERHEGHERPHHEGGEHEFGEDDD